MKMTERKTLKQFPEKKDNVKATSLTNEKRLAKEVGFSVVPGSGNQERVTAKGDGSHKEFLFELKETKHARVTISEKVIAKIYKEANAVDKHPAIILSAYDLKPPLPKEWVCLPKDVFIDMLRAYELIENNSSE